MIKIKKIIYSTLIVLCVGMLGAWAPMSYSSVEDRYANADLYSMYAVETITYDSKNFVVSAFWVLLRKYWRGPWPDRPPSIGAKQGVVVAFQQDFDIILVDLDFLDDELEIVPIFLFVNPLYLFLHLFLLEL